MGIYANTVAFTGSISSSNMTTTPLASQIAKTNTDGYLDRLVRDLIYVKLVPFNKPIPSQTGMFTWVIHAGHANGKTIKKVGAAVNTIGTATVNIALGTSSAGNSAYGSYTLPASTYYGEDTSTGSTFNGAPSRIYIYVTLGTGTAPAGLDVWWELG